MADFSDLMTATKAVIDPNTSGADLAQIAQAQPSLWPQVVGHPNAYPDLLTWLDANGDAATRRAVAAQRAAPTETVSAEAQGGHPAKSVGFHPQRRHMVIGGTALAMLVAIAIVLSVVRPWQTQGSSGPILTGEQLAIVLQGNPDLFDTGGRAWPQLQADIQASNKYDGTIGGTLLTGLGCDTISESMTATIVSGAGAPGLADVRLLGMGATVLLLDSEPDANALAVELAACLPLVGRPSNDPLPTDSPAQESVINNEVWLFGAATEGDYNIETGSLDVAIIQYGNVVAVANSNESWAQWQSNVAPLRQAIDQAAKK